MPLNKGPWGILNQTCPPNNAVDQDIDTVYRLVKNTPIQLDDFKPRYVLHSNQALSLQCKAKATSCGNLHFIQDIQKFPKFHTHNIAKGKINHTDGKTIIDQKNGHISWWISINAPQNQFKIIP